VKGDLQMHSVWSDGSSSIQEMAEAGEARGYEYIAITDHSKGLKIAGGIDEKQLFQQADDIAIVNESLRRANRTIRVLRSIEVNLSNIGPVERAVWSGSSSLAHEHQLPWGSNAARDPLRAGHRLCVMFSELAVTELSQMTR
jgi:hypothetical protein